MTREEAIRILDPEWVANEFAKYDEEHGIRNIEHIKAIYDACVLAISALREQEERRWILVTERLPEEGIDVLMRFQNNLAVGSMSGVDEGLTFWCACTDDGWCFDYEKSPTHWMPLPEPPKEE